MGKNTSLSLGDHFEIFVEPTIAEVHFNNAGEVKHSGLRFLEEEESRLTALKNAIQEGLYSGFTAFDAETHLHSLKAQRENDYLCTFQIAIAELAEIWQYTNTT